MTTEWLICLISSWLLALLVLSERFFIARVSRMCMFRVFVWVFALFVFVGVAFAVCEATGEGTCYYIDPVHGDDANDGSINSPWRTFANINSFYVGGGVNHRPDMWRSLAPGDVVYLREGVHGYPLWGGTQESANDGYRAIANIGFMSGTPEHPITLRGFPGENAVVGDISEEPSSTRGLRLLANNWWNIHDIEFRNAPGNCIDLAGGSNYRIWNITVHGCARKDDWTSGNPIGLHISAVSTIEVSHSEFFNNFRDGTAIEWPPNEGWSYRGRGIKIFRGSDVTVHSNLFYQTERALSPQGVPGPYAGCLMYKHASDSPTGYFRVFNNTFIDCDSLAFSTGSQNTHFFNNTIIRSTRPISVQNIGGPTFLYNITIEYNTLYDSRAFSGSAHEASDFASHSGVPQIGHYFPPLPHNIVFRNNIVVDSDIPYTQDNLFLRLDPYQDGAAFSRIANAYTFSDNCYYNPHEPLRFAVAAQGFQLSFEDWQSLAYEGASLLWDVGSVVADPLFVDAFAGDFRLLDGSPCAGMGAFASVSLDFPFGDVNRDGVVDVQDLLVVVSLLGRAVGDLGFISAADLNDDGVIDLFDLVLVARSFGT